MRIGLAELVELVLGQAEHAADVARRALAAVADHRGRQRRARAAVLVEHVLDHFLAPFVLEIDVDVGRLVAFDREEALEQQVAVLGIDRGDAEAVADRRVGRRAAALAEDRRLLCARPAHDVLDGQEEMFVAEPFDQDEFVLELAADAGRNALRPAPACAGQGQRAQMIDGAQARRHELVRIDVVDPAQVETATCGDARGFREQRGRIDRGEILDPAQMALAVREQGVAGLGDRAAEADRGQRILQGAPAAHMHVHIAAGDQGQSVALAERLQAGEGAGIVGSAMQFDRDPGAAAEARGDPCGGRVFGIVPFSRARQPDPCFPPSCLREHFPCISFTRGLHAARRPGESRDPVTLFLHACNAVMRVPIRIKTRDDATLHRLALRAIRSANVRFGILPPQSGFRRDDGEGDGGFPCAPFLRWRGNAFHFPLSRLREHIFHFPFSRLREHTLYFPFSRLREKVPTGG